VISSGASPGRKLCRLSPQMLSSVSPAMTHRMRSCTQTDLPQLSVTRLIGEFMCLAPGSLPTPYGAQSSPIHRTLWLGADQLTNNTGEISAFYHALTWVLDSIVPSATGRQMINIITDSAYCVLLFADNLIKPMRDRPSRSCRGQEGT